MAKDLRFYFDVASPYSHLAAARIDDVASAKGVTVHWRPILLGGIFQAVGNTMPAAVPARARYLAQDLERWARRHATPFRFSSTFPHNSLVAMRTLTAAPAERLKDLSLALFRAAWVDNQDISEPGVIGAALGSEGEALLEATRDPVIKGKLKLTTQEAIDAGAFGAPSFVVGDTLFWGNDRLEMAVEYAQ